MSLVSIIENTEGVYEGNLRHYFKVIFNHASNLRNPYHNFRHLFHVFWLCYDACVWYSKKNPAFFGVGKQSKRNLLIAALFHDFDHSGNVTSGKDYLQIARAIKGIRKHIAKEDKAELPSIIELIRATEYPHRKLSSVLSLSAQVIRDADMGQTFDTAWMQQIIFGLADEMHITPYDQLLRQEEFMKSVVFHTEWAQQKFTVEVIKNRIQEVRSFIKILDS